WLPIPILPQKMAQSTEPVASAPFANPPREERAKPTQIELRESVGVQPPARTEDVAPTLWVQIPSDSGFSFVLPEDSQPRVEFRGLWCRRRFPSRSVSDSLALRSWYRGTSATEAGRSSHGSFAAPSLIWTGRLAEPVLSSVYAGSSTSRCRGSGPCPGKSGFS